ncbi:MAG: hypothetical protein MUC43_08910 [Pirellula sp.]|jgi:hypothetical protein|nr:hypothetical protein [Pirellula sp.]
MLLKRITYLASAALLTVWLSPLAVAQLQPNKSASAEKKTEKPASDLPSVDDILARSIEAMGGKEKLQSIKSVVSSGSLSIPAAGINGTVMIRQSLGGKFKMTAEIPGVVDSETGSDGKTIWEMSNVTGAEILDGVRAEQARFQMALFPYLDMKKFFDSMECTGKESFAGEDCYVVVYKNKKSAPMTTYYSVKTGLEKGYRLNTVTAMGELDIVTEVKAYAEADGIKYASQVEATLPNGMKQSISMDKVEVNVALESKDFAPPADVAELIKK